jgi:hypothetical protein
MRKTKREFEAQDAEGEKLRKALGHSLKEVPWFTVKLVWSGRTLEESNSEDRARRMARNLELRMTNHLRRDPAITARALYLYDSTLPDKLMEHWGMFLPIYKTPPGSAEEAKLLADVF